MVELPNIWEEAFEKAKIDVVSKKLEGIKDVVGGKFTVNQVREKVEDFNSTIDWVLKGDDENYDFCRFRMFVKDLDVVLIQHPEVVSEIDKMYEINGELYNLIDYDEVDVDVRRYGTRKS